MGQKTNSNFLRLGYKNNVWNSSYLEKNFEESSLYVYQDIEIKKYIGQFFQQYNLLVHNCRINRSDENLEIFISYYITLKSIIFIHKINLDQNFIIKQRRKNYKNLGYSSEKSFPKKLPKKRLWIIRKLKNNIKYNRQINDINSFINYLLKSLTLFTNNQLNITIVLQNVNKGLSLRLKNYKSQFFRKTAIKLRKYHSSVFFREFINILCVLVSKKKSAKLLSELIAFQFSVIKRHNFFLNFLKRSLTLMINSKFSLINGVKLLIKGRMNGRPRSSSRIIQIGKVPLQTFDAKIDYFQSTAFSLYGTFGIKIWVYEK